MADDLVDALRQLRLPIPDDLIGAAARAASPALKRFAAPDHGRAVLNEVATWRETNVPSHLLQSVVSRALAEAAGEDDQLRRLATSYFSAHRELQQNEFLAFDQATAVLSQARLIAYLASNARLSASQIARVLQPLDERSDVHWQSVERVLRKLKLYRVLSKEDVERLWVDDEKFEPILFGDAGIEDAAAIVAGIGEALAYPGLLSDELLSLVSEQLEMHGPHLRMLFFQCLIADTSDHALTSIYEFSPRGKLATSLFASQLADLPGAMNAFLNNAKGVDRLDDRWARSRKRGERASALALVHILGGLDSMGFSARRELARALRAWVIRIMRLNRPTLADVPTAMDPMSIARIVDGICAGPTETLGILEQRIVDALVVGGYPTPEPWVSRGAGDSVNASNVSRRKFGDIEFLNAETREIVAYEAHAGHLSSVYAAAHAQSLRGILARRAEELLSIDPDPSKWQIEIVFVAHSFEALPRPEAIDGFAFELRSVTFEELKGTAGAIGGQTFAASVLAPLNERRTPQVVRDQLLDFLD